MNTKSAGKEYHLHYNGGEARARMVGLGTDGVWELIALDGPEAGQRIYMGTREWHAGIVQGTTIEVVR